MIPERYEDVANDPKFGGMLEMLGENVLRSLEVLTGVIADLGLVGVDGQAIYAALRACATVIESRLKQELEPATFANLVEFGDEVARIWTDKWASSVHFHRVEGP